MIDKGTVSALQEGGSKAEVVPSASGETVTIPLVVPDLLRANLAVGDEVVYATFADNTGIILERMDGKNTHKHKYTHGGTSSGDDETSGPVVK